MDRQFSEHRGPRIAMARVPPINEITERHPPESADERGEALLTPMQIDPLAKPVDRLDAGHMRLPWINLPRVDVKYVRVSGVQDRAHALEPHRIGNETKVAATPPRDPAPPEPNARDTDFVEPIAK